MSANPQTGTPAGAAEEQDDHADHPGPREYVKIALILAVLTALEYSTYVFDFGALGVPLLVVLIIIKFVYVASWFMHLKFDAKIFSQMMYLGLFLALTLYVLALVIMLFASATGVE